MIRSLRPWLIAVIFVALYWLGGVLGNHLTVGSDSVVLFWAPGAVGLVLLVQQGRHWWPLIAAADLLFSLTGTDIPPVFMAATMVANVVGALAAATVARASGVGPGRGFDLDGLRYLGLAALALALASLPFGLAGLLAADFITWADLPGAAVKWLTANVFGVLVVAPGLTVLWPKPPGARSGRAAASTPERVLWVLCLSIALGLVTTIDGERVHNAVAIIALPTLVLLWGAVRVPRRLMATGTLACGIAMPWVAASGSGALRAPDTTLEAFLLLSLLIILTLAPLILMGAIGESRRVAIDALRRARTDELTGLANRQGIEHSVQDALERGSPGQAMGLAFIDIDNFRLINDAGGQATGDAYLRSIGSLLSADLPRRPILGRIAGDQFVLLLRQKTPKEVEAQLEKLLSSVREYRHGSDGSTLSATASMGAITFTCGQANYGELLRLADAACATAKELGGNRLCLSAVETIADAVSERTNALRWAVRLERALREDHFRLYCQSIVPLGKGPPEGRHFEVLVRMLDPETGALLPPAQFIAAAEKFKLGPKLDRHVVDRTLSWLERNPQALAQIELCAINLCAASVNDPGFADFLRERFARSSVPAERICLEITETSAVRDLNDAQQFIAAARELGLKLALDDFGAGFCSFAYLRRLDVDYFKIDGSFVRDIESSALSLSIVQAIAGIARSIDKQTIAEFVENDAIRARLSQLGIDYAQGYGIDRPMPIEQYFLRPGGMGL